MIEAIWREPTHEVIISMTEPERSVLETEFWKFYNGPGFCHPPLAECPALLGFLEEVFGPDL